jgi:hypothetical protein
MLLLIDIFSINKGRGYENPSLNIIVTECCSIGGFPLEEAYEHCFLNQSVIFVVVLISFLCYFGDYASYITVILSFLAFCFCSAYFLHLVYCNLGADPRPSGRDPRRIFLNISLSLIDSLISPEGVLHTHK